MNSLLLTCALFLPAQTAPKEGWNFKGLVVEEDNDTWNITRTIKVDDMRRTYRIHLPPSYDPKRPMPVVVVLHGAGMTSHLMKWFTNLNDKADQAGFICVYPNGTGVADMMLTWNAGAFPGVLNQNKGDDVRFIDRLLDDLAQAVNVDAERVYCVGMSNGGMMTYRCGHELSHRFAAIASVAGVIVTESWEPKHPMPVLHFHGTRDNLVPYDGHRWLRFPKIEDSIRMCVKANGCKEEPVVTDVEQTRDKVRVVRKDYAPGQKGAEVVFYMLEGAGHVWPGRPTPGGLIGSTTYNIVANDLIWEFFSKYQRTAVK